MSLFLGSVVINVADLPRATRFWTAALDFVVRDGDDEFVVLTDPRRRWANVSLQLWDTPKDHVNRLHLDLYTDDQAGEVRRLEALGAARVDWRDYPPEPDFVVLADPDGNEFCVAQSAITQG